MRFYIITGEDSGDLYAANLVRELRKKRKDLYFRGFGGERLKEEGVNLAKHIKDISFMGITDVLKNLRHLQKTLIFCKKDIKSFNPDQIILIDYPGFNLKIAKFAKKRNIRVIYYVPPKVWAWNKKRINSIRKYVDTLFVIFPFEVEFYQKHNIKAIYTGNPLIDLVVSNRDQTIESPFIALLPGSRKQEIESILPKMLSIVDDFSSYRFVVAATSNIPKSLYQSIIGERDVELISDNTYDLLNRAEAALITSGTATLEAALLKTPQVVCYRTNWITYFLAKIFLKVKFISLVNILIGKEVVKELIQTNLNQKNIQIALRDALQEDTKNKILSNYTKLMSQLGKKGVSKRIAERILTK